VRVRSGLDKGELRWCRPNRMTLQNMLHNPIYAGAYVWGRRSVDPRAKKAARPSTGRKIVHIGDWSVCLRDRLPAYISWAQYESNLQRLSLNQQAHRGSPRKGEALLAGMVRCGRCGHRMSAQYTEYIRYVCAAETSTYTGPICQSLTASCIDLAVESLLLRALEPASIDVSLAVAADLNAEGVRVETMWQQRMERAQYDVDRSRRQYNAIEPENRLVARTIERQLEEHLGSQLKIQEDYRRYRAQRPATLTEDEREAIRGLASDIPALWHSSSTTTPQKKTIARQLIDDISVTVEGESERVTMVVTWVGGHRTETRVSRPVGRLSQLSYYADLIERARALRREGKRYAQIAEVLNAEGWRPAKRRNDFKAPMVISLLAGGDDVSMGRDRRLPEAPRHEDEWTLPALAHALAMHAITLHSWVHKGWVKGRKVPSANPVGMWLLWADEAELTRLRALRTAPRTRWPRPVTPPSTT
jgi:Recombinase zinc beta ribbon domain/Recombinase